MPSSQFGQIGVIINAVGEIQPKTILDVGCGYGKYGLLCREMLKIWKGYDPVIDAIEIDKNIIGYPDIYDDIYVGEALKILKKIEDKKYDLVLAIDILEHFDKEVGLEFLKELNRVGANYLVSTPKIVTKQGAVNNNIYETHRSQWSGKEPGLSEGVRLKDGYSHIFLVGEDAHKVKTNTLKLKLKFKIIRHLMKWRSVLGHKRLLD